MKQENRFQYFPLDYMCISTLFIKLAIYKEMIFVILLQILYWWGQSVNLVTMITFVVEMPCVFAVGSVALVVLFCDY